MKTRIALLSLLTIACLVLAVAPAMADTLYENGPVNGTTDAWTINFGFSVTNSLFCHTTDCSFEGIQFGVWQFPGDTLTSVQVQLGTTSFGNELLDGVFQTSLVTDLGINQFGYDVAVYGASWTNIDQPTGTYWVTLQNAVVPNGDPIYWDENSGVGCASSGCPSTALENTLGTIPSEAFTITGSATGTGTTPEPSSIMLFGSGILGLAGVLRRKLTR